MAATITRSGFLTSVIAITKVSYNPEVTDCAVCSHQMGIESSHRPRRQSRSRSRSPARGNTSHETTIRTRSPISPCRESLRRAITIHGSHVMCEACTQTWFEGNNTCPFCRKVMFANAGEDDDSNNNDDDDVNTVSEDEDEPAFPREQYRRRDHIILNDLRLRNDWVKIYHDALRGLSSRSDIRLAFLHIREQFSLRQELFNRQDRLEYWGEGYVDYTRVVQAIPTSELSQQQLVAVDSRNVNMLLWRWWWSQFTATLGPNTTSFFHHPVAMEILLATFKAVNRWQDWRQDMDTTKRCLGIALKPTILTFDGFAEGDVASRVAYLDDIMEAAAQAVVLGRIETVEGCDHAVAPIEAYQFADHMRIWELM